MSQALPGRRGKKLAGERGGLGPQVEWQWESATQAGASAVPPPTDEDLVVNRDPVEVEWQYEGTALSPVYTYKILLHRAEGLTFLRILRRKKDGPVEVARFVSPGVVVWRNAGMSGLLREDELMPVPEGDSLRQDVSTIAEAYTCVAGVKTALADLLTKLPSEIEVVHE
jgi:hypothetical protein